MLLLVYLSSIKKYNFHLLKLDPWQILSRTWQTLHSTNDGFNTLLLTYKPLNAPWMRSNTSGMTWLQQDYCKFSGPPEKSYGCLASKKRICWPTAVYSLNYTLHIMCTKGICSRVWNDTLNNFDTLNWYPRLTSSSILEGHTDRYSVDTPSTLDQQSVNSQPSVAADLY